MNDKKKKLIISTAIAVVIFAAVAAIAMPASVVANEASTVYTQVQESVADDGSAVQFYDSENVTSASENDPDNAVQGLGSAELVKPVGPDERDSDSVREISSEGSIENSLDQVFDDKGNAADTLVIDGENYYKQFETTEGGHSVVYESDYVEAADGESGLGSAELIIVE